MGTTVGERATSKMTAGERRATLGLAGVYGFRMLGLFLILPVFALFAEGLPGATPFLTGLAIGIYGLTQAALQIPFGLLSDRIGRKPVIFGGLLLFALGSVIAAMAEDIWLMISVVPCRAAARSPRRSWRWPPTSRARRIAPRRWRRSA